VGTDSSFRVYNGSLLASVLSQINPVHAFAFYLSKEPLYEGRTESYEQQFFVK